MIRLVECQCVNGPKSHRLCGTRPWYRSLRDSFGPITVCSKISQSSRLCALLLRDVAHADPALVDCEHITLAHATGFYFKPSATYNMSSYRYS